MTTHIFYGGAFVALMMSTSVMAETTLTAVRAEKPPVLDGSDNDAVWTRAAELQIEAEATAGPREGETITVRLKAAYDDSHLYFLLSWHDASKDDTHKSYVWNEEKSAYEVGPDREDVASLSFPIRGTFTGDMLSGTEELWDVWHWKAARTAPAGYAMDKSHAFSATMPTGKANKFKAKNGSEVWIARPEDTGGSATRRHAAPDSKQGSTPVHYEPVKPSGSAADVRTGHAHRDASWTVEFARKLRTGHADDAPFSAAGTYLMGIAVFDKSEDELHYVAGPIALEFRNAGSGEVVASFEHDPINATPKGWNIRETNPTEAMATWHVLADASAPSKPNVLALTKTKNVGSTFNLAIAKNASLKDLDLTVQAKAVRGEEDQGGGPIWRCTDENNYYVCRFNPLESNFRVYKVVDGKRKQLDSAEIKTQTGKWYTVRVTMAGNEITCYLDGAKLLVAKDDTFKEAGMVGLWTKADAATSFDSLVAHPQR